MKKILLLLFVLASVTSFAQFPNYTNINGRYKWIAGKFDSTFTIPSGTTPSLRVGGGTGPGALFYSTTDSTVYQYTGTRWTRLRGTDTAHVVSAYVRNTTASTMTAGQVVYINGSTGTTPTIALAVNTADSTSAMTFGFVRGTIAANGFGWITSFGPLEGVNTNAYDEGEVIYLDSIPGQFTHDKPQAPYHMVTLGYIVKKSGGNGTIFAKIQNGYELDELHNVKITSPVPNKAILAYDSVAQLWKDTTLSAIGGITGTGTTNYIPKFTSSSAIGNSQIFESNTSPTIGFIGIATTTPQFPLQVYGSGAFLGTGSTTALRVGADVNNNFGLIRDGNDFYIQENLSNVQNIRFTIKSGGNVSIGNTNNTYKLDVTGDARFTSSVTATAFIPSSSTIPTNGLYLPAANSLGFATNSTERLRISSSGNVSIGSTNNTYKLDVTGDGSFSQDVRIGRYALNRSNTGGYYTGTSDNFGFSYNGSAGLVFNVSATPIIFGTSNTERMRLDASGNLGLGTSPAQKLDIYSASTSIVRLRGDVTGGAFYSTQAGSNATHFAIGDAASIVGGSPNLSSSIFTGGFLGFYTGSSTNIKMTLDASGNLGLGVTPSAWSGAGSAMNIGTVGSLRADAFTTGLNNNTYFNGSNWIYQTTRQASRFEQLSGQHIWYTAPSGTAGNAITFTQAMTLDASGRLGIGSTSPQSVFDITGATPVQTISTSVNTALYGIEFKAGTYLDAFIKQQPNTGEFRISNGRSSVWGGFITFYTDVSERMRITSGGEILINTTTDAGNYKLQVNGNTYTNGTLTTAAPSGGTAKPWKLGTVATVSPTSPDRTIEVEIDGTTYYIHAKTTNN